MKEKSGIPQAPYLRAPKRTRDIMGDVCISLAPALLGAVYFWGARALFLSAVAVISCVAAEYVWEVLWKRQITVGDYSAVVTGILLAFNMPVTVPWWVLAAACVFAIVVIKEMFGGIGNNVVNPALMGRLFVMVLWPASVMGYVPPRTPVADSVSSATVLTLIKGGQEPIYSRWQMFLGEIPGAMGETSKMLLLVGFAYMCYKGVVNMQAAGAYLLTALTVIFILGGDGLFTGDVLVHLLGGSLILGACYMLTDYAFVSKGGRILYGVAAGALTALLRIYSPYPEGVCFGILLANCLAGLLAEYYKRKHRVYGVKRQKQEGL